MITKEEIAQALIYCKDCGEAPTCYFTRGGSLFIFCQCCKIGMSSSYGLPEFMRYFQDQYVVDVFGVQQADLMLELEEIHDMIRYTPREA